MVRLLGCVLLGGCAGILGIEDLPTGDGDDAAPVDGVTVRFVRGGAPVQDVRLIAHDSDGSLAADLRSDDRGEVLAAIETGGMVTVVATSSDQTLTLTTVTGLQVGDVLTVELEVEAGAGTVVVNFTGAPPATTQEIIASSSCEEQTLGAGAVSASLAVDAECLGTDGAYDVMLRARENNLTIAKSFAKGVTPGVPATASAWEDVNAMGTFTYDALGVSMGDLLGISEVVDGQNFNDNTRVLSSMMNGTGTDFSLQLVTATGFADFVTTFSCRRGVTFPCLPAAGDTAILRIDLTATPAVSVDMNDLGEVFAAPVLDLDGERPRVTWTGGGAADYRRGTLAFGPVSWRFAVDNATGAFTLPELPADLVPAFPLDPGDVTELMIQSYEHSYVDGYRDAIAQDLPHNPLNQALAYDRWPVREGAVVISSSSGLSAP